MADIGDKVLGMVFLALLVPIAITSFNDTDTTTWTTTQVALWALLGIVFLLGIVRGVMKKDGGDAA